MPELVYNKIKAYAEIEGSKVEITNLRVGYTINQIPVAAFDVAIGTNTTTLDRDDTALEKLFSDEAFVETKVFVGLSDSPAAEPTYKLLFEGYITAPHSSTHRSVRGGSAYYGVNCIGKAHALLSVMRNTGKINAAVSGVSDAPINATLSDGSPMTTAAAAMATLVKDPLADIWENIKELADESIEVGDPYTDREISETNAAAAIARINTGPHTADLEMIPPTTDSARDMLKSQMFNYFTAMWYEGNYGGLFNGGSVWDAIEQIRKDFILYFVATPENDYLLPITLCLGGSPYKTITANEYYELTIPDADATKQVVDAVVMYDESTPAANPWERDAFKVFTAAAFLERDEGKEAAKPLTYPMPEWAIPRHPSGVLAAQSLAGSIPDASNPDVDKVAEETYNQGVSGIQAIGDAIAEAYLWAKAYESRALTLSGKVRFDIAPGSLVAIQIIGDRFGAGFSGLLYGHVVAVNIVISGEQAYTQLTVAALRFEGEQAKLSDEGHPLFEGGPITGFPLIEE